MNKFGKRGIEYRQEDLYYEDADKNQALEWMEGQDVAIHLKLGYTVRDMFINALKGQDLHGKPVIKQRHDRVCGYDHTNVNDISIAALIKKEPESEAKKIIDMLEKVSMFMTLTINSETYYRGPNGERIRGRGITHTVRHGRNRSNEPCEHDHRAKAGICLNESGGVVAVDGNPEFENLRYFRALDQKKLDEGLQELHYKTVALKNAVGIAGFTPEKLREAGFMQRAQQIDDCMQQHNMSESQRALAVILTSQPKTPIDYVEHDKEWRAIAAKIDVDPTIYKQEKVQWVDQDQADEFVVAIGQALAKSKGQFTERELITECLEVSWGQPVRVESLYKGVARIVDSTQEMEFIAHVNTHGQVEYSTLEAEALKTEKLDNVPFEEYSWPEGCMSQEHIDEAARDHKERVQEEAKAKKQDEATDTNKHTQESSETRKSWYDYFKDQFRPLYIVYHIIKQQTIFKAPAPQTIVLDGAADPSNKNSLQAYIKGLYKTNRVEVHKAVLRELLKQDFGSISMGLDLAESIYQKERRPKNRLHRNTTVIIENAESMDQRLYDLLRAKCERKGATLDVKYKVQEERQEQTRSSTCKQTM